MLKKAAEKATRAGYVAAGRKRVMLLDDMGWIAEETDEQVTNRAFLAELLRAVRFAARCELTQRQQSCFQLYFESGLTVREIAKQLELNDSTVSRHIAAARKKVQRYARYCAFGSAPGGREGESRFLHEPS